MKKIYDELLENIRLVNVENKGQKLNSDELLRTNSLKTILLKFRLLEKLTSKGKNNYGYCMNPILYIPEINYLLLQLNYLILYNNKKYLKTVVSYCLEHHQI